MGPLNHFSYRPFAMIQSPSRFSFSIFQKFLATFNFMSDIEACRKAMELVKSGDWHGAHDIVEQLHSSQAAHVHAYLHRVEGDQWNADYWYRRAGQKRSANSIEEEWQEIYDLFTQ